LKWFGGAEEDAYYFKKKELDVAKMKILVDVHEREGRHKVGSSASIQSDQDRRLVPLVFLIYKKVGK
jgi:hypothetical protein